MLFFLYNLYSVSKYKSVEHSLKKQKNYNLKNFLTFL